MTHKNTSAQQSGAALIVGLVMLVLITVMLLAALNIGTTNFRAVGNMQFREEAIAAANAAIQERMSSSFDSAPTTSPTTVDINRDGVYEEVIVTPTCIAVTQVFSAPPSSLSLGPSMSAAPVWNTTWDITATVTDPTTGTSVAVSSGVRVQLSNADKVASCDAP
jgi:hypothetical protein